VGVLAIESKNQTDTPHDEMLSGWKDIANYLGKGIRTVQRYERELGLPVRRLPGHSIGSVIALKSDLDSWVRSSATAQELINRSQKAINVAQDSLNLTQDSLNKEALGVTDHLVSEITKGLQERTDLQAQMTELRKELRMSVSKIRENLLKLRQQVNEMRRRQDVMASVIKSASGKHRKPN